MSFMYVLATLFALSSPSQRAAPIDAVQEVVQEKDSVTRVIDRLPLNKAKFSIQNRKQAAALLLLDTTIVLQMTDAGLKELGQRADRTEKPSGMPKLIEKMLMGSIRALLDHGIEYSLSDLKEARVENGVLVLESKSGERVFAETRINDEEILATFSEANARRFAMLVNAQRKR